jgi:hypothetical protein
MALHRDFSAVRKFTRLILGFGVLDLASGDQGAD